MSWIIGNIYTQNGNYSQYLHTLCTVGPLCHAWLFFPSSSLLHDAVALSFAGDQLLILFPAWRARPSPIPPTRVDPISFRLQAPSQFSVGHKYNPTTQTTSMLASYMNRSFTDSIGSFKVFVLYNVKVYCPNWRSQLQWEVIELSGQLIPHP